MNKQKRTRPKKEYPDKNISPDKKAKSAAMENADRAPDNTRSINKNHMMVTPVTFNMHVQPVANDAGSFRTGVVNFFNVEKGYGFIRDLITHETYFVYRSCLKEMVVTNDMVSFEIEKKPGGLIAVSVRKITLPPSSN